jgi:1-acyl-sn-glycerol-3-phosphate acyltransferase
VKGGAVLIANHQSYLDIPLLSLNIFKYQAFVAKKELFEKRILKFMLKNAGCIPVNREKVELSTVKRSLSVLKQNKYLTIFPQGTRVVNGKMENLKSGGIMFSAKSQKPIVPIWIKKRPRPFVLNKVVIGMPIYPQNFEGLKGEELNQSIESEILKFYRPLENELETKQKSKK